MTRGLSFHINNIQGLDSDMKRDDEKWRDYARTLAEKWRHNREYSVLSPNQDTSDQWG